MTSRIGCRIEKGSWLVALLRNFSESDSYLVSNTESSFVDMSSWRKSAVQKRSQATEIKLSRAARKLLSTHPFSEIRVDDVARKAGISVGGFYARYRGKTALLHLAHIDFLDDALSAFDEAVPDDFEGPLESLFRSFVTVMVHQFDSRRDSMLQSMKHLEAGDTGDFRTRTTAFNQHVHGRMRRLIASHKGDIRHDDLSIATNMSIFIVSAAARDAVVRQSLVEYPIELSLNQLIEELITNAVSYLTGRTHE